MNAPLPLREILKNCKCCPINDFSNVYSLNDYSLPEGKDTYNKYLPLSYLKKDLDNSTITFVSPITWTDPFELRYYKIKYSNLIPAFNEPDIYCMCLTEKQAENEDAMWRVYAKPGEEMVKAYYSISDLLTILSHEGEQYGFDVYIGRVIYADKTEIKNASPKHISNFSLVHYLTLMSIKRKAYKYENEVRIFLVPNSSFDSSLIDENLMLVKNRNNLKYVNRVIVSPYPPIYVPFPNPLMMQSVELNRDRIKNCLPASINTEACRLFEPISKCTL